MRTPKPTHTHTDLSIPWAPQHPIPPHVPRRAPAYTADRTVRTAVRVLAHKDAAVGTRVTHTQPKTCGPGITGGGWVRQRVCTVRRSKGTERCSGSPRKDHGAMCTTALNLKRRTPAHQPSIRCISKRTEIAWDPTIYKTISKRVPTTPKGVPAGLGNIVSRTSCTSTTRSPMTGAPSHASMGRVDEDAPRWQPTFHPTAKMMSMGPAPARSRRTMHRALHNATHKSAVHNHKCKMMPQSHAQCTRVSGVTRQSGHARWHAHVCELCCRAYSLCILLLFGHREAIGPPAHTARFSNPLTGLPSPPPPKASKGA